MATSRRWRPPLDLVVAVAVVALDQLTKYWVLSDARLVAGGQREVIPGFFHLVLVWNTGAAWGLFHRHMHLLALVSLVVGVAMVVARRRLAAGWPERTVALGLVFGGIVGNLYDRLTRDGVVDFLSFFIRRGGESGAYFEWPAFNIADSGITVGVALFILSTFLRPE